MHVVDKKSYFIWAMKNRLYRYKAWIIDVFSASELPTSMDQIEVNPPGDYYEDGNYPYRILNIDGYMHYHDDDTGELVSIGPSAAGFPMYGVREGVVVTPDDAPNVTADTKTTYGTLLVNYFVIIDNFGKNIPFLTGKFTPSKIEALVAPLVKSDPVNPEERRDDEIYVSQAKQYINNAFAIYGLSLLCVPTATPNNITTGPEVIALRDRLIEENKGHLHDPAVIAGIIKQCEMADRRWIESDPDAGFYFSDKSFKIVRMKLFIMQGIMARMTNDGSFDVILTSLDEGVRVEDMPIHNNALRDGINSRSILTALGGTIVKELNQAAQDVSVAEEDCGSTGTLSELVTKEKISRLEYLYHLDDNDKPVLLTKDLLLQYEKEKKTIRVRTPGYCKTPNGNVCLVCMGDKFRNNEQGVTIEVSDVGSRFMYKFMKAMHGNVQETKALDVYSVIS